MSDGEDPPTRPLLKLIASYASIFDGPVTYFKEKVVDPIREKNKVYYYHRKLRRVPTIDECYSLDSVCIHEANEQFKRDRDVERIILKILRKRWHDCEIHYFRDMEKYCTKPKEEFYEAQTNYFIKYGDIGFHANVKEAYMKQKHRMIWERRHGEVGTGMKSYTPQAE